jgi:eukaryotic-like serine/threonine-protein kinase
MANTAKQLLEFGPFRVDPEQRQLSRNQQPIPLSPKTFDLLLALMERSGQVVLKDELMNLLWPETFVEESNLTQQVFQLRKALDDRSQASSYIVTVPGKGYRFVQEIRALGNVESIAIETHSVTHVVVEAPPPTNVGGPLRNAVIAAVVGVVALAAAYHYTHRTPRLTEKDTVVLADFANSTGDTVFDGALREALSTQLEQSPFLNLLPEQRVAQTLSLMAQAKDARLTPELAQEVCERTASTAVLDGTIAQIGTRYLLTLRATNCSTGESLASTEAQAKDKDHVLDALGKIASEIRGQLGESLVSVQKYDAPPEDVTTRSLEALQAYNLGYHEQIIKFDFAAAIPFFQRAISLDPNFAMAHARLGTSYGDLGEGARAAESTRRAYELRDRVSEREKFYITSHFEDTVMLDLEAARKTYELWSYTYPRDYIPLNNLGYIYGTLGEYDKDLASRQASFKLDPGNGLAYGFVAHAYLCLNRLDESEAMARQAQAHHLDSPYIHATSYLVDFLKHDEAGMEQEAARLTAKPLYDDRMLYYESDTAAYFGQMIKARDFTKRAAEAAEGADEKETARGYEAEAALREALVGDWSLAREQALAALKLSNGRDVEFISAIALLLAGDSARAGHYVNDLDQRFPKDTVIQSEYLPMMRAAAILGGGNASKIAGKAIEALAPAAPYEQGALAWSLNFAFYPVYFRGEAYLAAGQGAAALAEFQKIADHPGVVVNEPIGALAHLGMGRAYALSGDSGKAKDEYEKFLNIWKDADPGIPLLKQARTEYAKLRPASAP